MTGRSTSSWRVAGRDVTRDETREKRRNGVMRDHGRAVVRGAETHGAKDDTGDRGGETNDER